MNTFAHNRWAARLASLALVLAALLPSGTMLARNAETGLIEITICSGAGSRSVLFNPETGDYIDDRGALSNDTAEHGTGDLEDGRLCPYALAGATLPAANAPVTDDPAFPAAAPPVEVATCRVLEVAGAPLPPRGPPSRS